MTTAMAGEYPSEPANPYTTQAPGEDYWQLFNGTLDYLSGFPIEGRADDSDTPSNDTGGCPEQSEYKEIFLHGTVGIAIIIILIFGFLEKRSHKYMKCCKGRPGLVVPLNLLDDIDNRWAYACSFGAITNTIVVIFTNGISLDFEGRLITKVIVGILLIVEVCINLFPFFACLATPHKIVGNIIGFLYAGVWFGVLMYFTLECMDPSPEVLPYIGLVIQMPTLLCLAFLVVWFAVSLGLVSYRTWKDKHTVKESIPVISFKWQDEYVRDLINKKTASAILESKKEEKSGFWQTCKDWISDNLYEYHVHFKYSGRLFCSLFVVFMCTYQLGVVYYWWNAQIIDWLDTEVDQILTVLDLPSNTSSVNNVKVSTNILNIGWQTSTAVTLVLFILDVLAVFVKYRSNLLMLFRGDKKFMPHDFDLDNAELMRRCMLFSGYQVGFMIWGFFVMNFVMWILVLLLGFVVVLPAMNGYYDVLIYLAEIMLVPLALDTLLRYVQTILSRVLFLQPKIHDTDKEKPLALNNRKSFHIANYFFFFSNIATGLISCLMRILYSIGFGLLYLGRLDQCVLMGGRESWDVGHNAYLGMILIEAAHNNPILRVFCQHLTEVTHQRGGHTGSDMQITIDSSEEKLHLTENPDDSRLADDHKTNKATSLRARRKWHLAYTLLNNPELIIQRRVQIVSRLQATERHIDVSVTVAKRQRCDQLRRELEDLEREIAGDDQKMADQIHMYGAFTICSNIATMNLADPKQNTDNGCLTNRLSLTENKVDVCIEKADTSLGADKYESPGSGDGAHGGQKADIVVTENSGSEQSNTPGSAADITIDKDDPSSTDENMTGQRQTAPSLDCAIKSHAVGPATESGSTGGDLLLSDSMVNASNVAAWADPQRAIDEGTDNNVTCAPINQGQPESEPLGVPSVSTKDPTHSPKRLSGYEKLV